MFYLINTRILARSLSVVALVVAIASCSSTRNVVQQTAHPVSLKFIGEYVIPFDMDFKETVVGGLSGIDYDPVRDLYYFISDDRSDKNPARFYVANIGISEKGIDTFFFLDTKPMRMRNGEVFPNKAKNKYLVPDPEAIRYNPKKKELVWSSEGERIVRTSDTVLADPSITIMNTDGQFIDSFPLPPFLRMQAIEKGPRQNGVFEGMSFANGYKDLYVSIEEPLYEDGPRADTLINDARSRILKFDVATRRLVAQYIYPLERIQKIPSPKNGFKVNGIPDILDLGNNKLLVIERSFSSGTITCTIKVFVADLSKATKISDEPIPLQKGAVPVEKKLLLNMDDLGMFIDNIEGVTFGPTLANGHKTLLFVADNNFSFTEKAQVLLFEVIE